MVTVLQFCEHFGGRQASLHGVARGFQWWIPAFDSLRFRVLLCSRKGRDRAAEVMEEGGLCPLYLGYGKYDPRNLAALIRLLRRERVDIIHAHGYGACTWGRLAGLLLRIPVIVHERCNTHTVPLLQRPAEWLLAPLTRHVYAVSASTREFCIRKRFLKPDRVEVLYNGILMEDIPPADETWIREFRESRGVGPGDRVIGIVGRLESHKGHLDAFAAVGALSRQVPNVRLWVVGDGSYAPALERRAAECGMEQAVDFLGFRADVRKVMQCFDVQLFPSHMEGTPNTLFEALAAGHAIVASTTDGQGEILEDGKTALLFAPGDTEAMGRALLRVLQDDGLRAELRRNAAARAGDFDGRKTIETMQQRYEAIVAEKRGGGRRPAA